MTTYVNMIEDTRGDLIDIEWFCGSLCFVRHCHEPAEGHRWPCGPEESDSDTFCSECNHLMRGGLAA